jgi:hypothetical protein
MDSERLSPPSLLVLDTTSASPLSTSTPTRSAGHIRRAEQRMHLRNPGRHGRADPWVAGKEKRLVKGTFSPRNPIRFETTVDAPTQPPYRRTLRPRPPDPGRHRVGPKRRHHPHQQPVALPDAFAVGQRSVHRSVAPLPQATVGSGSSHPTCPLQILDPFTPRRAHCFTPRRAHCPTPAPTPMSSDLPASHQEGVTPTTHLPHTQCKSESTVPAKVNSRRPPNAP